MNRVLALLVAATLPASARLGESIEQCRKRYGNEIQANQHLRTAQFLAAGVQIWIQFRGDTAVTVSYSRPAGWLERTSFTEVEIDTILKANQGDSPWEQDLFNPSKWVTRDLQRVAAKDSTGALTVSTVKEAQAAKEAEEAKQKAALKGL